MSIEKSSRRKRHYLHTTYLIQKKKLLVLINYFMLVQLYRSVFLFSCSVGIVSWSALSPLRLPMFSTPWKATLLFLGNRAELERFCDCDWFDTNACLKIFEVTSFWPFFLNELGRMGKRCTNAKFFFGLFENEEGNTASAVPTLKQPDNISQEMTAISSGK